MWAHPGKQLLFMGAEIGQESEWAESRELDWWLLDHPEHLGVHRLVKDLNAAYTASPAIWSREDDGSSFEWIDANDAGRNVFSFVRRAASGPDLVCVSNFAAVPHEGYRIGLPHAGRWREIINTDSGAYGGSGVGNLGAFEAEERPGHSRPASATLRIPPLGALWLRPA